MAAFEFPTIDLRSFRVDNFAALILLETLSGDLPVMVKGDGNCLFDQQALSHLEKRANIKF